MVGHEKGPVGASTHRRAEEQDNTLNAPAYRKDRGSYQTEDDPRCPKAPVHLFVDKDGYVGAWMPRCPNCGDEHVHGPYLAYAACDLGGWGHDPRVIDQVHGGRRSSHCCKRIEGAPGGYRLRIVPGPVRFVPGAERSRFAAQTMKHLERLGLEVSREVIPTGQHKLRHVEALILGLDQ